MISNKSTLLAFNTRNKKMCTFERFCFLLSLLPATFRRWCIHDLPNLKGLVFILWQRKKKGHENKYHQGRPWYHYACYTCSSLVWGDISLPIHLEHEGSLCSSVHTQSRAVRYEQATKVSKEAETCVHAYMYIYIQVDWQLSAYHVHVDVHVQKSIVSFPDPRPNRACIISCDYLPRFVLSHVMVNLIGNIEYQISNMNSTAPVPRTEPSQPVQTSLDEKWPTWALYDTESEGELPSGYSEDESSDDSSGTDEFTSPESSIDGEISDASASESVPSSSTATDTTESESSFDISELSDASTNKLSKLLEFHTPLYEGADLTILDSYLMLYQFALRHCITDTAFSELISLVDTHVPKDAKPATSLYKLRNFFESKFNDLGLQLYTYSTT